MKNQYKRLDVFRCTHESHQGFGNVVSVFHVLKEKGCYPEGCVYFKWRCKKLERGLACKQSFEHVGRKCTPCSEYYDEKIVKKPQLLLKEEEYRLLVKDLHSFDLWLREKKGKQIECGGEIKTVKPRCIVHLQGNHPHLSFRGFLLVFHEIFLGLTPFEDTVYALISSSQQAGLRLGEGDQIEFQATLGLDRGRVILNRLHRIEVEKKVSQHFWTEARARQAMLCGSVLACQDEKCLQCPHGCLMDIEEGQETEMEPKRRKLLCLKGIMHPEYCIIQAEEKLSQIDNCQSEEETLPTKMLKEGDTSHAYL